MSDDTEDIPRKARFTDRVSEVAKVLALIGAVVTGTGALTGWAFRAKVVSVEKTQVEQGEAIEEISEATELLFQSKVEMTTELKGLKDQATWQNTVLFQMARDQGLRVPAPPAPSPSPAPRPTP